MSKHLVVLRHGHALNADADFERTLSPEGQQAAARAGQALAAYQPRIELVISSTAVRAEQTAQAVIAAFDSPPELRFDPTLYLAPPTRCVQLLEQLSDELSCVALVGHNPGLSELVERLWGERIGLSPAQYVARPLSVDRWLELS